MFLSSYAFAGPSDTLVAGYHTMIEALGGPGIIELNVCVVTSSGITVFDGCPTREDFESFSTGEDFAASLRTAGLPAPVITPLGEVHVAFVGQGVSA